jgi:Bles03-like protein
MADSDSLPLGRASDGRKPSEVSDAYWLFTNRRSGEYPEHSERGGKWLLFVPVAEVDQVWEKVRVATECGRLGGSAKVATARPSPRAKDPAVRVICVYTYDWMDEADVGRVRAGLRELGFTARIAYKADNDTLAGNYSGQGKGRVSRYYE